MAINYPQKYDDDFLNTIKTLIDHVNQYGKTIQDLVADGQLTEEQYAELITVINGLLKSGHVDKSDLTPEFKGEIEGFDTQLAQKAAKGDLAITNDNVNQKVNKDYVDTLISSISDGTPEAFNNLTEIESTYPSGSNYVKLNLEDGYVYKWGGSAWIKGWLYQNSADIEKITSKLPIINLIDNGDFSKGLEGWTINSGNPSISTQDFVSYPQSMNVDSDGTSSQVEKILDLKMGHKYYVGMQIKVTRYVAGYVGFRLYGAGGRTVYVASTTHGFTTLSRIHEASDTNGRFVVGGISGADLDGFIDNIMIVDLTETFGAGNEPTIQEFEELLVKLPDGFVGATINPLVSFNYFEERKADKQGLELVPVTNMIKNGDFSNGQTNWVVNAGNPIVDGNKVVVDSTEVSSQLVQNDLPLTVGHKYYAAVKVNCTRYNAGYIGYHLTGWHNSLNGKQEVTDGLELVSGIHTATESTGRMFVGGQSSADLDGTVEDVILVDLTEAFGEGNEPTKDEFDSIISKFNHWFDGNVPSVMGVKDLYKEIKNLGIEPRTEVPEHIAKQAFIEEMNKKAERIGMANTNYVNPSGLEDANQVSTVRDTVLLGIYAMGYNEIVKAWNKKTHTYNITGGRNITSTTTTSVSGEALENYYHIFGGKTGTNSGAYSTRNLLTVVNAPNGHLFVGAVFKASDDRFQASKELYDIAKLYMDEGYSGTHDISANMGAVALIPLHNPFAYEGYDIPLMWGKNENLVSQQASITKVMTAIITLDYTSNVKEKITILESDLQSGSGPNFRDGDVITIEDALYAMMLPSSNTAAVALSRIIGAKIVRSRNE